jgi:hypothetical protein
MLKNINLKIFQKIAILAILLTSTFVAVSANNSSNVLIPECWECPIERDFCISQCDPNTSKAEYRACVNTCLYEYIQCLQLCED